MRAHEDFASFYHETRDRCLRAVYASTGDVHRAEDLVAEAYARALARWPKVSRHPAPAAWIVRTALNLHVSWWRRGRREYAIGLSHGDVEQFDAAAQASRGYGSSSGSLQGELPDPALLRMLRSLPRRQREVVVLRILLDLDTAETARELGMASGTVKVQLSRALATLRERLTPYRVHHQMEEYAHDW
ncbi:MAG TPA: SigE family RNA polymerase sigma factor [Trebonia sp.]|nr:SigE family RNA polymerase sigma factor [Trebonia sp.]